MILTLEVVGPQATMLGEAAHKSFDTNGGSIGRSRDNDWVIPDSYISGNHARIHFRNGRFFIVDNSANGTSLRTRANRLTRGQWYALDDMDRLFLDTVEVRVRVDTPAEQVTAPIAVTPPKTEVLQHTPQMVDEPPDTPRTKPLAMPTDAVLAVLLGERDVSSFEREFLNTPLPDELPALKSAAAHPNQASQHDFERTTAMPPGEAAQFDGQSPQTISFNLTGAALRDGAASPALHPATPPATAVKVDAEYADIFTPDISHTQTTVLPPGLMDTQRVKSVLAGAGIPSDSVTPELTDTLTDILRVCIQGLLELQTQREAMKDSFHLSATKFKPAENNPLRFSANVEDALYNLLVKRNPAYLAPAEAVTSSFKDAQWHQAAMLHALRAGFFQMLQYFDPQQFNAAGGKRLGLFNAPKNTPWEHYGQRYAELRKQADGGFSTLFGDAFARAYQEELDRLRQS